MPGGLRVSKPILLQGRDVFKSGNAGCGRTAGRQVAAQNGQVGRATQFRFAADAGRDRARRFALAGLPPRTTLDPCGTLP
jgi:hypothetical protein